MKITNDLEEAALKERRYKNGEMKFFEKTNYLIEEMFSGWNDSLRGDSKIGEKSASYILGRVTPLRIYTLIFLIVILFFGSIIHFNKEDTEEVYMSNDKVVYLYSTKDNYKESVYNLLLNMNIYTLKIEYPNLTSDIYFNELLKDYDTFLSNLENNKFGDIQRDLQAQRDLQIPIMSLDQYSDSQILTLKSIQDFLISKYSIPQETMNLYLDDTAQLEGIIQTTEYKNKRKELLKDEEFKKLIKNINDTAFKVEVSNDSITFIDVNNLTESQTEALNNAGIEPDALAQYSGLYLLHPSATNPGQYQAISNTAVDIEYANLLSREMEFYTVDELPDFDATFFQNETMLFLDVEDLTNPYIQSFVNYAEAADNENVTPYNIVFTDTLDEFSSKVSENTKNAEMFKEINDFISQSGIYFLVFDNTGEKLLKYIDATDQEQVKYMKVPEWTYIANQEVSSEEYQNTVDTLWGIICFLNETTTSAGRPQLVMDNAYDKYFSLVQIKDDIDDTGNTAKTTDDLNVE